MYDLYKGATREPTFLGVPRNPMIITIMLSATLWMNIHFWALGVFLFLWFVEYSICKYDDRMFRIIGLWFRTKGLNALRTIAQHRIYNKGSGVPQPRERWGGNSYTPTATNREDSK